MLIRIYYLGVATWGGQRLIGIEAALEIAPTSPLWPVAWILWAPWTPTVIALYLVLPAAALGAACMPERRWLRIACALALLFNLALSFSYGKINHSNHLQLIIGLLLILLPNDLAGRASAINRTRLFHVFVGVQATILLSYTQAGLQKIRGIGEQLIVGDSYSALNLEALSRLVAGKLVSSNNSPPLGAFVIEHPWLGFLLWVAIYLEFASIFVLFRPELHRLWGVSLICMHWGILLTMGISFSIQTTIVAMMLVASPFAPTRFSLASALRAIPLFGKLTNGLRRQSV